jgi:uncharacterized protein
LTHQLKYRVLQERPAVCRAPAGTPIPAWASESQFFCLLRTLEELSVVCPEHNLPEDKNGWLVEDGWVALQLQGPFPFSLTGVLASFLDPLAKAEIPIFALSTFDTDYVLIKQETLPQALIALSEAGHKESVA